MQTQSFCCFSFPAKKNNHFCIQGRIHEFPQMLILNFVTKFQKSPPPIFIYYSGSKRPLLGREVQFRICTLQRKSPECQMSCTSLTPTLRQSQELVIQPDLDSFSTILHCTNTSLHSKRFAFQCNGH